MKEKNSFNFIIGLLIGVLVAMLVWYWQKSTRTEDGALALLDRLKDAERRVRELRMGEGVSPPMRTAGVTLQPTPPSADNLQDVKGIGPVFDDRLQKAGITTFTGLVALSAERLAEILEIRLGRAEAILAEAGNI